MWSPTPEYEPKKRFNVPYQALRSMAEQLMAAEGSVSYSTMVARLEADGYPAGSYMPGHLHGAVGSALGGLAMERKWASKKVGDEKVYYNNINGAINSAPVARIPAKAHPIRRGEIVGRSSVAPGGKRKNRMHEAGNGYQLPSATGIPDTVFQLCTKLMTLGAVNDLFETGHYTLNRYHHSGKGTNSKEKGVSGYNLAEEVARTARLLLSSQGIKGSVEIRKPSQNNIAVSMDKPTHEQFRKVIVKIRTARAAAASGKNL